MDYFKRPLVPALCFYVLGLWMTRDLWPFSPVCFIIACGSLLVAGGVLWMRSRECTPLLLGAFIAAGCLRMSGILAEQSSARAIVKTLDDRKAHLVTGIVSPAIDEGDTERYKMTLKDVAVTSGALDINLPGKLRLTVSVPSTRGAEGLFTPGERVRFLAPVEHPEGFSNFFLPDYSETLSLQCVYAVSRLSSPRLAVRADHPSGLLPAINGILYQARRYSRALIFDNMPAHEGRMVVSMLFNERSLLTDADQRIFRDSNTMHLFAVSGLHVCLFAFVLQILFRSMRFAHKISWTLTSLVLFLYVLMLDFVAPAERALFMVLAITAGYWMKREVDVISSLTFGVGLILLTEPLALWQASFILSVMCVFGIIVFTPLLEQWIWPLDDGGKSDRLMMPGWKWCKAGICIALGVMLMLLPLQLLYFQQINLLSPLANMVVAGLSMPVLGGTVTTIALGSLNDEAGRLAGAATAMVMKAIYEISRLTALQEWAILRTAKPPLWAVTGYYLVMLSGYYFIRRDTPEFPKKSFARLAIHLVVALALVMLSLALARNNGLLRIWFLDVGQGDSTIIQTAGGQTIVIDAGNQKPDAGRIVVAPMLRVLGASQAASMIATHGDADHVGGIPALIEAGCMKTLVTGPGGDPNNILMQDIENQCQAAGIARAVVTAGNSFKLGPDTAIDIINPEDVASSATKSDNNQSVVLRISYGRFSALLMGDAESAAEKRLIARGLGQCDILKVGHHGSRSATTDGLLSALNPRAAIISCGRHNRFGHPDPAVVGRLKQAGAMIYRTDQAGAILVETDGATYTINTVRSH